MSRILALILWLIAIIAAALLAWSKWQLPPAVSAHAGVVDHQFKITMAIIGIAFLLVHGTLGLAVWRFRKKRGERAAYSQGNTRAEILWAAATAVVFLFLAISGQVTWWDMELSGLDSEKPMQVEVTGQQFIWNFRYPGADDKFGRTDPQLYNDADNSIGARPGPLGIDPKDAAGRDDVVSTGVMVVPVNRRIYVILRAKDVTHDFYVPALRLKQDAVPGSKISIHFTATREGRYEIACAELCGQLHHQMRAYLDVKSQEDFEKWLKERMP